VRLGNADLSHEIAQGTIIAILSNLIEASMGGAAEDSSGSF
jgi:hypothetical protein